MFLGIDLGTSGVKAVLVDDADRVVARQSAPLAVNRPRPGWAEQAPDDWITATEAAICALPASARRLVQAIGLSGQMHGLTALDARDRPLRPAILWNDGRAEAECRELEAAEPGSRAITGNRAMPGFTAPKALWLRRHEPEIFRQTRRIMLPKDYLRLALTGEAVSDMSDAAGTLWLDVARRAWSPEMLAASGVSEAWMPRLVEGSAVSGRLSAAMAARLGLERVVVAGGGGDNAATGAGMGAIAPGDAFLSLGTSGVLFVADDAFHPHPARAIHAFCHCLPARWHLMAVSLSAAASLDWVAALTGFADVPAAVAAATAKPHPRAPIFLPYLSGERTPHDDPAASGVFWGLSADTAREDMVRAVLEGVAFALRDGMDALLDAGAGLGAVSVTGGGARLAAWCRIIATVLGRPLEFREGGEVAAALGAARLARLAVTGETPETVCRKLPVLRLDEPDRAAEAGIAERLALYRDLYLRLAPTFRVLNRETAGP